MIVASLETEVCFWCGALNWEEQPCVECNHKEIPLEEKIALMGCLPRQRKENT